MTRRFETLAFVTAFTLLGATAALLCAQDPDDPFGGNQPAPMKMPAKKDDDDKAPKGPPPTEDVLILSIRESDPQTPKQLMFAIKALLEYGAVDEAKRYLAQLIASKPSAADLAGVQREFGSAFFIRLATDRRVRPEGTRVATAVMQSARLVYNDPARLRDLAVQAGDPDPAKREEAQVELRNAGAGAVASLVDVLANPQAAEKQAFARDALVALGEAAVDPLLGVMESSDPQLRTQVIAVLTRLKTTRVVFYLLRSAHDPDENPRVQAIAREALKRLMGKVPSQPEVEQYLYDKAVGHFAGNSPLPPDSEGLVTLWRWDNDKKAATPRYYPANPAAILLPEIRGIDGETKKIETVPASSIFAAQAARDLYLLFPKIAAYKRLFLATQLEAAKLEVGLDTPLPQGPATIHALVSQVDPLALEETLGWSIKNDHFVAAIATAEVLGGTGDATLLTSTTGAPRPLALALRHPDRRLRFAAADTIVRLNSPQSFPGASFVPETLGYLAGTVGTRRALIADPRVEDARSFGGLLSAMGYDVDVAATGDEALSLVLKQPDYEVVFLGDGIDHQDLLRTWQQIRKDPRTANLLVAMLYREEHMLAITAKAESDALARAMPYIHTRETLEFQMDQLFRKAGTKFVPFVERQQQAAAALDHLAFLATDSKAPKYYDLLRQEEAVLRALGTAGLTVHAAPVLGGLASHQSQLALANLASDSNYDLIDRQAAAKAFADAVARKGLLLTTREIEAQFDRYNASELQDEGTQQVLAAVLDVIEKKK